MKTNETKSKKKLLQDQVIKLLQSKNTTPQGESNADIVRLEKKFDAVLKLMNERMATQLLTKIEKHVMVDNLDKALGEVTKAIEQHKTIIPKSIEVVQNERPKWYKDPLPHPKSIKVDNTVEVKGHVKSDIDWGAFGSVLNIAFQGLFEFLNKYAQKTFRIMPAKEHYTTPQMIVIVDPKTGRPVSLQDIGGGNGNTIVQMSSPRAPSSGLSLGSDFSISGGIIQISGYKITLEFMSGVLTTTFYAPFGMTIDTITNVLNSPTTSITVGGSPYTLETSITQGAEIVVTVSTASVIRLNITR